MEFLINNLSLFAFVTVGLVLWSAYLVYQFLAEFTNLRTAGEPNTGVFLVSITLTGLSVLVTIASAIMNLS